MDSIHERMKHFHQKIRYFGAVFMQFSEKNANSMTENEYSVIATDDSLIADAHS